MEKSPVAKLGHEIESKGDFLSNDMGKALYKKLPTSTKFGFGVGAIGDSLAYDWVACFFIYFLTDSVGISPVFAGFIIMISIIWDGFTDITIGSISDKCRSKYGRRRPFILGAVLPLSLIMILMFINVPFKGWLANIYYLVISLLFWTSYTAFNIPYYSLGVSLSYDENERNSIRAYSTGFAYFGDIGATFLPTMVIGIFKNCGWEQGAAWTITSAFLAILTFITIMISWWSTRGKEIMVDFADKKEKFDIKEIIRIIKPRSIIIIFIISFLFYMLFTIRTSSTMYFVASNLKLGELQASFIYLTTSLVGIIVIIALTKLCIKYDKKYLFLFCVITGAIAQIAAKYIGINSLTDACIYAIFGSIGDGSFCLFTYSFIYDATDIEEFRSGKRQEGILVAYQSFIMKLGSAVGIMFLGIILKYSGYIGSVLDEADGPETALNVLEYSKELVQTQSPKALGAIESMFTIYPGIITLIAVFFILILPITKKKYEKLLKNLRLKRKGEKYSMEGFEDFY